MENKIVERIELNTDAGKYIKCNSCGRLSPEQKYCKYCFSRLHAEGGTEVKSVYITRSKGYSPVSDYSRIREKIDSEFKANEVDFAALGMTEEEYNMKFTPPALAEKEEYRAEVSQKFGEIFKRYDQKVAEKGLRKNAEAAKERESVKQIIIDTPVQAVFTAAAPVAAAASAETDTQKSETDNKAEPKKVENLTVRRESSRFQLTFLSATCFAMNLVIISTLFIKIIAGAFGMDIISLIPSVLGAGIRENAWITAASADKMPFIFASASYLLLAGISLYQFFAFAVCVLSDKKQKNYAEFVLSFTALLAGTVMLFSLLLSGFSLTTFSAGAVILFLAAVIHFICATGKMLRD